LTDFALPASALPLHIPCHSRYGIGPECRAIGATGNGSSMTVTANQAYYYPVTIPWPYPVQRVFWANGSSVAANKDFGIYTPNGARIYSTGSTAEGTASAIVYTTVATPFILGPGMYYFALVSSGGANHMFGLGPGLTQFAMMGGLMQTTALPLPNPATFATSATTAVIGVCGITRTASGY
jgi:hypothetical protein